MSLIKFSSDYLLETFTLVDNLFLHEHLPYCDEKQIKIYLYGLYLCSAPEQDNTTEHMCTALGVGISDIMDAYAYFEDAGLVRILSKQPLEVKYLCMKRAGQPPKKYKAEKWNDFNVNLQQLFPERMLTPNEYNEYYSFLDSYKTEPDAMLMIAQYCINLKGANVRYPYILAVAKNWAQEGVLTVRDVEDKLNEYDAQTEDMREVLKALGRRGGAELDEKQMLLKWTRSWGFELSAVLQAAKTLKGGRTFKSLDKKLDEFYRMSIFTAEEIKDYHKRREYLLELTVKINKTMGLFYESLDHIIEVYTVPWINKGFDEEALTLLAHHCFISGIRSLDGLNGMINKFFARGAVSKDSINEFISAQIEADSKIKAVIEASGRSRNVTNSDREYYKTWTADWGFDDGVILYAASQATGRTYPLPYINQLLSGWRTRNVRTVEDAKRCRIETDGKTAVKDYTEREYSESEVRSVITGIDTLKDIDI